jgi:hypothetical protein
VLQSAGVVGRPVGDNLAEGCEVWRILVEPLPVIVRIGADPETIGPLLLLEVSLVVAEVVRAAGLEVVWSCCSVGYLACRCVTIQAERSPGWAPCGR